MTASPASPVDLDRVGTWATEIVADRPEGAYQGNYDITDHRRAKDVLALIAWVREQDAEQQALRATVAAVEALACICAHDVDDHPDGGRCRYDRQVYGSGYFCDCGSYRRALGSGS